MSHDEPVDRLEAVGATIVAVGVGLIAFMVAWIAANRVASQATDATLGPILAMSFAVLAGTMTSLVARRRLLDTVRVEASPRTGASLTRRPSATPTTPRSGVG